MKQNMMCSNHKSTNDAFRKNYDSIFTKKLDEKKDKSDNSKTGEK